MKKRRKKNNLKVCLFFIFVLIIIFVGGFLLFKGDNKLENVKDKNHSDTKREVVVNKEQEKAPSNYQDFLKLDDGEYITDKGYTLKIIDRVAYVDDNIIVNKTYSVPSSFIPKNPNEEVVGERCNQCINKDAMDAFTLMKNDSMALGLHLYISSGYRSYSYQDKLYNRYVANSGKELADTYSARPGHSEHQTGTCFDLNTIDDSFANTSEGKWVNEHAYLYGFIIRYPKGKENITGYQYESWHLRYVGKELAKKLYNDGEWLTLEEYYGITSSYE